MPLLDLEEMRKQNKKKLEGRMETAQGNVLGMVKPVQEPNMSVGSPAKIVEAVQQVQPELEATVKGAKLGKDVEKKVIKDLGNPDKVGEQVNKEMKGEAPSGPKDNFVRALSFFAPQLLGGVIGAAMEGTSGAIAGMEESGKARDAYNAYGQSEADMAMKERKMELERQMEERRIKQQELEKRRIAQADRRLGLSEEKNVRDYIDLDRRLKAFEILKGKAGQLSDKQTDSLAGFDSTLAGLNAISDYKSRVNTGPIADMAASSLEKVGMASDDFTSLKVETENIKASFLKAMSGAQVSDAEARRLARIIPNVSDDDKTFNNKMRVFNNIVNRMKDAQVQSIAIGQPLREEMVKQFRMEAEQELGIPNELNAPKEGSGVLAITQTSAFQEEMKRRNLKK